MPDSPLVVLSISPISLWSQHLNKETAGAQAISLAQEGLARAGHKPILLIIKNSGFKQNGRPPVSDYRGFQVRWVYMPGWLAFIIDRPFLSFITSKLYYFWYYVFAFFSGLSVARKERADIIMGYTNYSAIPAFLISRLLGIPYIYRENGTWDLYDEIRTWRGRVKRFDATLAFRLPCEAMVLTDDMTQTDKIAEYYGVPKEKVHFWRNGIFKKETPRKDREEVRRELGFRPGERIVVSVGRLSPEKRFDRILKAFARVTRPAETRLVIVGDGPAAPVLKEIAREAGIEGRVIFTGAVSHNAVDDYMYAADLVVALGSINPLLEGMNAGRCVISLDLGATRRMTDDGRAAVVIRDNDLPDLGRIIEELLTDDARRGAIEQNALRWISAGLESWDERIQKEVGLIERLALAGRR